MNLDFSSSRIKSSFTNIQLFLIFVTIVNKIGLIYLISFLSKHMNIEDFGIFRYSITISNFYAIPMVGINSALVTFLSNKTTENRKIYTFNSFLILLLIIILELLYFVYNRNIFLGFFVFVSLVDAYYIANLSGNSSFKKINLYRLTQITLQIIVLYLLYCFNLLSFRILSLLFVLSTIFSILIIEYFKYEVKIQGAYSYFITKKLIKFSNYALIGSISFTLYIISNTYFIKKYFSLHYFAKYTSVDIVSNLFTLIPISLSSYLIASISKSKSSKDSKKLLYFNLTFFIIVSIISIIFIFYYYSAIMNFIFKKDSFLGNNYFFWTSFNYILLSIHLYFSYYFFGKNKPKIPAISMTITLLVNFCLSSYLINSHGIFGLLFSNFISIIIGNVVIYFNFFCHED